MKASEQESTRPGVPGTWPGRGGDLALSRAEAEVVFGLYHFAEGCVNYSWN